MLIELKYAQDYICMKAIEVVLGRESFDHDLVVSSYATPGSYKVECIEGHYPNYVCAFRVCNKELAKRLYEAGTYISKTHKDRTDTFWLSYLLYQPLQRTLKVHVGDTLYIALKERK